MRSSSSSSFWTARTAAASASTSPIFTTILAVRPGKLATLWLGLTVPEVSVDEHPEDWQFLAQQSLKDGGSVRLSASPARLPAVTAALPSLLAEEVEADFLLLPVSVRRIDKEGAVWKITLQLKEAFHA